MHDHQRDDGAERAASRAPGRALLHWFFAALLLLQWAAASAIDARPLLRGGQTPASADEVQLLPDGSRPSARVAVSEGDWTLAFRKTWSAGADAFALPPIFALASVAGDVVPHAPGSAVAGAQVRAFQARAPPAGA